MLERVRDQTTLLEWMQNHENIVQIEKSGTPGIQKWWIITRLEKKRARKLPRHHGKRKVSKFLSE